MIWIPKRSFWNFWSWGSISEKHSKLKGYHYNLFFLFVWKTYGFFANWTKNYIYMPYFYWMQTILHDWTDEQCIKILKRCKEAIHGREDGGKVVIVDIVMNDGAAMTETQLFWDIQMLCALQGKEREEHEWRRIFLEAGFTDYKISPLGIRSLIEVFPWRF